MLPLKYVFSVFVLVLVNTVDYGYMVLLGSAVTTADWTNWMHNFQRTYPNSQAATYAQYYYNYNKKLINAHNVLAERGLYTYTLRENQFSDMRLTQFRQLFPRTTPLANSNAVPLPAVQDAPPSFDPIVDLGMTIRVEDQGRACSSGWAYATAKAIEIMQAQQFGNTNPPSLSAQNLIDCAGVSTACTTQVPQTAFDYLSQHNQGLHLESNYKNMNQLAQSGMCVPPPLIVPTYLASYSRIPDADDATMMKYVAAGYPVVIEFDPTSFEFMHYGGGVFQQPRTSGGSHYMTVIGFGRDATRQTPIDYWLLQNSFGTEWGEMGRIRIVRNAANTLAKSALFPVELGP